MAKITAGQALAQVLVNWQVDHLYGITADSINNTVEGLYHEREHLRYIQVRHEEVGALAAAADAKLTQQIGVCFGSAGPGAVHLLNGLYEAKMDHVPVLAIVGQVASGLINTNFFQEMNEDPIVADVAAFHQQVTTADQIPYVIDQAIRYAYQHQTVAAVIIPDDLAGQEIDFTLASTPNLTAATMQPKPQATADQIQTVVQALKQAQRPIMWLGRGAQGAQKAAVAVAEKFSLPVLSTVPATGVFPTNHPAFMGSRGRLGTKPAFEVSQISDLILSIGSNYPFARFLPEGVKFIQVNNNGADLGKQFSAQEAILADASAFLEALTQVPDQIPATAFFQAAKKDKANWDQWLKTCAQDDQDGLRAEGVIQAVKDYSHKDAIYGLDVGNNTEWSIRQLPFDQQQKFAMSPWYGTMGFGLPAGLAAQLSYPERQVWTISGDGGFAMVMPDLITEVKYQLPVVNIVLDNQSFGYIQHEKLVNGQSMYGIPLNQADWGQIAQNMGAHGFTVHNLSELRQAFEQVQKFQSQNDPLPVVIDAQIQNIDPIDTSFVAVNEDTLPAEKIAQYRQQYQVDEKQQPSLQTLLKQQSKTN
ncbi:pyruvate oxidase [Lactobacillus sp. DCY120]|uniref:Pyruvate oxidase n=1 Tax=Bombilactobacillus apium TaxID=2675299 RepID=A0A850QXU6_9LACO|nr:thiamine pyrophosphate-dependent enzyme [Bombilactobacillus apium]NVY96654.1 pyruvate oxidase [Bombilactobacillus apium]